MDIMNLNPKAPKTLALARLAAIAGLMVLLFGLLLDTEKALAAILPSTFFETDVGGYWEGAVGITFDEIGTMYEWDRDGRVWVFENDSRLPTPVLDISEEVGSWSDHGMLG